MTEKKKPFPKEEKPEMDMNDMEMPEMKPPMMGGMCPMMHGHQVMCPMMCPMMQMQGFEEQRIETEDMRSPDWYEEDDSDYSSDDPDEYPGYWKYNNKYKCPPYPFFWPPFYSAKPYKKKHKKW